MLETSGGAQPPEPYWSILGSTTQQDIFHRNKILYQKKIFFKILLGGLSPLLPLVPPLLETRILKFRL